MSQLLETLTDKTGLEKSEAFYAYLRRKAWEKGIPLTGVFELTPRCTLDCKMCYVHLNKAQMKQAELTTGQWIALIDQACRAGMAFAILTGGECLLHPGFKQIYEHLQSNGVLVSVFTNGTLLDEKMVSWLAERPPERIQISVYGSNPAGYQAVTGEADAFYKVDGAIDLIKRAGLPFTLAITVSKQMAGDFEAVLKYCSAKKPARYTVTVLPVQARAETERNYEDYAPTLDEQAEIYKTRLKFDGIHVKPYPCEDDLLSAYRPSETDGVSAEERRGVSCTAGRSNFAISWDGRMLACSTFNFAEAWPLRDGFGAAWQEINARARAYHMPAECFDCSYKRACTHCPAAHWLGAGEGHCNPALCKEGKRMALEGIRKLS